LAAMASAASKGDAARVVLRTAGDEELRAEVRAALASRRMLPPIAA
jgi:hypothetical protein